MYKQTISQVRAAAKVAAYNKKPFINVYIIKAGLSPWYMQGCQGAWVQVYWNDAESALAVYGKDIIRADGSILIAPFESGAWRDEWVYYNGRKAHYYMK